MFKLLRYFSVASLLSIATAAVLLGAVYRYVAIHDLLLMGERNNVSLARTLSNVLRAQFEPLVAAGGSAADPSQRAERLAALHRAVLERSSGLSLVKVKIYDLRGMTVYSSDPKQIGEDKSANQGFRSAAAGQAASELTHRDTFSAFEQVIADRDLLSSYIPVLRGEQGTVEAVFEIYDDVTPMLQQVSRTQQQVIAGVALVLSALYGILFLIVRRADGILRRQYAQHLRHEDQLQAARDTLERRVADRTVELARSNSALQEEVRERERTQEQLVMARHVAEAANRAKSQFLTNMSHEIRTPLNGVLGMAELLQTTALDDVQRRYCRAIMVSGRALHDLLGHILDVSKIESGRLQIEVMEFDIAKLLGDVADAYRDLAASRGIEFHADFDLPKDARIAGDPTRLRQVLSNLLGNAVKFTERGSIALTAHALADRVGDSRSWVRCTVRDSGIGMSPETMSNLFKPFTQADRSTTRKYGGSGLGLVIAKSLTEHMGGSLEVQSMLGSGSVFRVDLPFTPASTVARIPLAADHALPQGRSARVLVAEDNELSLDVARAMLEGAGHRVELARDGAEAVRRCIAERFDCVLMDCHMPVMDGIEATRRIREHEAGSGHRTQIVALTAHAMVGDRERYLQAGMDEFLAKPVTRETLLAVVGRMAGAGAGPAGCP